jgi:hypothetical protein
MAVFFKTECGRLCADDCEPLVQAGRRDHAARAGAGTLCVECGTIEEAARSLAFLKKVLEKQG